MKTRAYIGTTRVFSKIKPQEMLDHIDFSHNDLNFFDENNISVTRHQPSFSHTYGRSINFRYPGDANFIGVGSPVINDVYAEASNELHSAFENVPLVNSFLKFSINNVEIESTETLIIQTILTSNDLSGLNIPGANRPHNLSVSPKTYSLTNTSNLTDLNAGSCRPQPSEGTNSPESLVEVKMTGIKIIQIEEEFSGAFFINPLSKTITFSDAFHDANQTTFTILLDNTVS